MEKQRKTFLSYSRANKDFAIRLAKELKSEGFHVWLDQLDIPLGARWDVEVEKALEESEIFMIIMTPASIASENVRDEIGYAIDNGKRFLPVLLENCTVPLRLRRFQYVDFSNKNFDEGVEAAKELLRGLIAQPTVPRIDLPEDARKQMAQAEADRKAREEADRVAKQKADEELAAKAETERKAKEKLNNELAAKAASERRAKEEAKQIPAQKLEEDRLAKQQVEQERISKARLEADRKATGVEAMPVVEMKAQPISASTTQKKPVSRGLVIGGVAVVAVLICAGIGFSLFSNLGTPAAEVPATEVPSTEVPSTNIDISTKTSIPNPTATAIPIVQATRTKTTASTQAALPDFFTIQFNKNTDLENFDYYEMGSGDDSKVDITQSDDGLTFLLNDQSLYVYYIYEPYNYEDVIVRMRAENTGTLNNNNVSLVCRMTDHTWYEFSVTSGGLWDLYDASNDDYMNISNGGTTALKTGQNVNDYEMRCIGNNISLYINGQEVTTIKDDLYKEGQVGFNISSLNVYPIEVQVTEFEISEP